MADEPENRQVPTGGDVPARVPPLAPAEGADVVAEAAAVLNSWSTVVLPLGPPPSGLAEQRTWAELRKVQLETERVALEVEGLRRKERDLAADADRSHVYTFYTGVEAESVQQCMAELGVWSRRDPGAPITIVFNSPGGSVLDGLALFDYLRHLRAGGHHVTTVALGRAASMGAVLLQGGDRRIMGANAFLLVHEVSNLHSGKVSEMEDGVEFSRRLQRRLLSILANRSTLTEAQIQRRWARKEWWLDADEAVELGLADAVQ
jgi:ATP-dependent Clp endopeptidase proteolytic subunit ClpP